MSYDFGLINNPEFNLNFDSDSDSYSDASSESEKEPNNNNNKTSRNKSKKIIYDNCEIYYKEKLIGICSRSRFNWYLRKNIANKLSDNSLELLFDPVFKSDSNAQNKQVRRKNMCYCCGETNNLVKFASVPTEYKKYFPMEWKSHNSFDILSLCRDCSDDARSVYTDKIKDFEKKYNVSRHNYLDHVKQNSKLLIKSIKKKEENNIPTTDLVNKLTNLLGYYPSTDQMENISKESDKKEYDDTVCPEEYVIKKICELEGNKGIEKFIREWKDYFVKEMEPDEIPEDFYFVNYDHN